MWSFSSVAASSAVVLKVKVILKMFMMGRMSAIESSTSTELTPLVFIGKVTKRLRLHSRMREVTVQVVVSGARQSS